MEKSNTVDKDKSNIVDEFWKNSGEQEKYIISINHFQGNDYIDARLYFKPDDKEDFLPSRKGISMSIDHLDRLIEALNKVKNRIEGKHHLKEMRAL